MSNYRKKKKKSLVLLINKGITTMSYGPTNHKKFIANDLLKQN